MTQINRLKLHRHAMDALQAFEGIEQIIENSDLPASLRHLVKLRASQMNGCAFCVKMHTDEARKDGESSERLDRLVVWEDVDDFTDQERTAFAWTEALTRLDKKEHLDDLHAELTHHFSDSEISALTVAVAMINIWNRLQVASHGRRQRVGASHAL